MIKVKKYFKKNLFLDEHCRRGQFCPRIVTWPHLILQITKAYEIEIKYFFMYIFCIFVSFMFLFVSFSSMNMFTIYPIILINILFESISYFLSEKLLLDEDIYFNKYSDGID